MRGGRREYGEGRGRRRRGEEGEEEVAAGKHAQNEATMLTKHDSVVGTCTFTTSCAPHEENQQLVQPTPTVQPTMNIPWKSPAWPMSPMFT